MPPSRKELEDMADDLGITGEELAVFLGDTPPKPPTKRAVASPAASPTDATSPKPSGVATTRPVTTTSASPTSTTQRMPTVSHERDPYDLFVGPERPVPSGPPPRPAGVGPRVAAGMEPLPSPNMAEVAGVAGNTAATVYDARMDLFGEVPGLRDRVNDVEGFNTVMSNVERQRGIDAAKQAKPATVAKPAPPPPPVVQPPVAPPPPKPASPDLQTAIDGLRRMGVPEASIQRELAKGPAGAANVIDVYRSRTE